ncbi:glutathione S-transferase family protein [Thalassotalea fonticola]|uniref:Glutathione S-transferase family protein n=1 Tax=Thalassotalea fonticola TaxID=3065649 RepID=A0ABZ0GLX0_9GAMM|nr:glutathione S-transferase family protein [Colwelliaceae bacterium S1-1]
MASLTLYGAEPAPFVRKVRLTLAFKGLDYTQVPVFPFSPDKPQTFVDNSPTGKIPLFQIDDNFITDSDVIIAFLEREYPNNSLLPADNILAARALWFNQYASSTIVSSLGGHLFVEMFLAKAFFNREPIQADIDLALNEEIPSIFTYLETELSDDYLVGNEFTLADLSVGAMFVFLKHCKVDCDASKWPKVAAYIDRVHSLPIFAKVIAEEIAAFKAMGVM